MGQCERRQRDKKEKIMRIGLAQMDIFWENVQKNMEKAEDFIKKQKRIRRNCSFSRK